MAFESLYYRHKNRVYTYLTKRVRSAEARDEIFQSTFLKFHRSRNLYDFKYPVIKWLYTILRSEFLDYCKKGNLKTSPLSGMEIIDESPSVELPSMHSLTEAEQLVINARYLGEEEYQEISSRLNISESNARKLLSRAIKKLKAELL